MHHHQSSNRETIQEVDYENVCNVSSTPFAMKDNIAYSTVKITGTSLKQTEWTDRFVITACTHLTHDCYTHHCSSELQCIIISCCLNCHAAVYVWEELATLRM